MTTGCCSGFQAFLPFCHSGLLIQARRRAHPYHFHHSQHSVIPAKAGIQWFLLYIPAWAGMTIHPIRPVLTAKAGVHLPSRHHLLDSSFRWNDDGVLFQLPDIPVAVSFRPAHSGKTESTSLPPSSFPALRHSSESWNPVVFTLHSRLGGNDHSFWPAGAGSKGRGSFTIPASPSWIPAFAGMTTGARPNPHTNPAIPGCLLQSSQSSSGVARPLFVSRG